MPKPKYGWDSCVFITVLTGEQRDPEEIAALMEVIDAADRANATIVTSTVTLSEVLDDDMSPTVSTQLELLFRRPNFIRFDVSAAVATRAREIRQAARKSGRSIQTPDAQHLATALAVGVDAFHTFDDKLLRLDGSSIVGGLRVCKPQGSQTVLGL